MCTRVDNRGIRCTAFYLPYKDLIGDLSSAFTCMNSSHGFSIWRTGRYNLTKFADFQRMAWLPWMMTCILCITPICYLMLVCSMLLPYGLLWGAAKVSACPSAENLNKQVSLSRIFRETQQTPPLPFIDALCVPLQPIVEDMTASANSNIELGHRPKGWGKRPRKMMSMC